MYGHNCINCSKKLGGNVKAYFTDCTEGFGDASYCEDCILKETQNAFNNPKLICTCGKKMTVYQELAYFYKKKWDSVVNGAPFEGKLNEEDKEYTLMKNEILNIFSDSGMLYFGCMNENCLNDNGVGVYVNQRFETTDIVWENDLIDYEKYYEYVYNDYLYTSEYNKYSSLFETKYNPIWFHEYEDQEIDLEWGYIRYKDFPFIIRDDEEDEDY